MNNSEQYHDKIDNANKALNESTDKLASSIHQAVDTSTEKSHRWLDESLKNFNQLHEKSTQKFNEYSTSLNEQVTTHPVKSLLIAGISGAFLGWLFTSSKKKD